MKEKFLQKVPNWYKNDEKYDIVLSDDIDGLVSTSILKYVKKNWDVEYFYDFETLYASDKVYSKKNKSTTRIWSDVSILYNEKTFDNHVNRINLNDYTNKNAINPNILCDITKENYFGKYAGSTALLIWNLFDLPLPKTELGKMILLCIDTTYKGFFGKYEIYRNANKHFLCDVFGYEELYELQKQHSYKDFYDLIGKYNLSRKTRLNEEGYLQSNLDTKFLSDVLEIPVQLPKKKMTQLIKFEKKISSFNGIKSVLDIPGITTVAFTGKNQGCYSVLKK